MEMIVKFPEERKGVLIGKKGEMKRIIEKMGGVRIDVGDAGITVRGEDSLKVMKAAEVIKAIGFGFNPYDAFELFRDDLMLAIYDVENALPNSSQLERQMGRIIGEGGKTKRFFEKTLGVNIMVSKKQVGAIGEPERLEILREALEKLIHGAPHSGVYRYVERRLASARKLNL